MPLYTVFAPPVRTGETAPDPLRFVFVKDGFCWPALFFPEIWLLFRRMWLVFVIYVVVALAISAIASQIGGPLPWTALTLAHLLFALEGNALRRWKLRSRGYDFIGVVEGRRSDVELRFFADWEPPIAPLPPAETASTAAPDTQLPGPPAYTATPVALRPPSAEAGDVVGLFPAPGGAR